MLLYFAYGSNMSSARLCQRVPSAQAVSVCRLAAHRLVFHKVGRDGSAKCDVVSTRDVQDLVYGVLYRIEPTHKPALDAAEGLGRGYAEKTVRLSASDGSEQTAFLYYATDTDPALRPFSWYKEHVLRGAREHALPTGYVALIAAVEAITDSDAARHAAEIAVYR